MVWHPLQIYGLEPSVPVPQRQGVGERGRNSEAQDPTVPKGGKGDEGRTKPPNPSARKIKAEAVDQMGDALAGGKGRRGATIYVSDSGSKRH